MANIITSPNMNLPIPVQGVDPGPDYANNINASLGAIDLHNHSSGQGVQIGANGINLSSDLTFNNNNAVNLFTARFQPHVASLAAASPNIGCLYVAGNELYYNDVSGGHAIPITSNGSVVGSAGTIGGMSGTPASVNYASNTFTFWSNTNTTGTIACGPIVMANNTALSNTVTIYPPTSIGASYALYLPTLPSVKSIMALDSSGNISAPYVLDNSTISLNTGVTPNQIQVKAAGITSTQIASGTITGSNIASSTITGSNIAGSTITGSNIASGTITSTQISGSAGITGSQLSSSAGIVSTQLASNTNITGNQIAGSTITSSNLAANSVTATQLANNSVATGNIQNQAVTLAKLASSNYVASSNSGPFSTTATTAQTVMSLSINTSGRPVLLMVFPDGDNTHQSFIGTDNATTMYISGIRNTTVLWTQSLVIYANTVRMPYSTCYFDVPSAGNHSYAILVWTVSGGNLVYFQYHTLLAVEI